MDARTGPRGRSLTTKTFNPMRRGRRQGLSRDRIRRQLDSSLERLGIEPSTSTSRTRWIRRRRSRRRSRHSTSSSLRARSAPRRQQHRRARLEEASRRERGRRSVGAELLLAARARRRAGRARDLRAGRLGYTPFSPLAGGWLTGKYRRGSAARGLADDDAAGAVRPLRGDEVFDALEAFRATAPPSAGRRPPRSRSRGCSRSLRSPRSWSARAGRSTCEPALDALELDLSRRRARTSWRSSFA